LSNQVFDTAPRVTYNQFLCYMKAYQALYWEQTNIFLLKKDSHEIGFVSSFFTDTYFVIKTIGILQEYRKQGYGNMLLDHAFQYYFSNGIYESYGIYMRKTGEVMHMSDGGGSLYRKYFTYIYTL
jgi:ribosomal protein S18 acetylase RimI-like enzyme